MQTFLPYSNFHKSASCLDVKRLGKQRVECLQLLNALAQGPAVWYDYHTKKHVYQSKAWSPPHADYDVRSTPWYNHPAARMWRGYEYALSLYGCTVCDAWVNLGFKDTCFNKICILREAFVKQKFALPLWLGNEDFHRSHRSNP